MLLSSLSRNWYRGLAAISAAVVFAVAGGAAALADDAVLVEGDGVTPITASSTVALGNVCVGETDTASILVAARRQGGGNSFWVDGASLVATASATGGATALVTDSSIGLPANWANSPNGTFSSETGSVTITVAPTAIGALTGDLTVTLTGPRSNGTLTRTATLGWAANAVSCNTAPSISVNDVTLEGDTLGGRTLAFAEVGTAGDAEDPAAPSVTCTPTIGSLLPLGATTVTCTATDSQNLTSAPDTGSVTVRDSTRPVITGTPGSVTLEATAASGATHAWVGPTASDVVWGTVAVTCEPPSGSTFPIGARTVTCTATDGSSNTASSAFQVNVQDETAPAFMQPADVTAEATSAAGATVTFETPYATDAVSGTVEGICNPASSTEFALGDTTVECTATDGADNKGRTSFVVHVVDTIAPSLDVPVDFTKEATSASGALVSYTATATDAADEDPTLDCAPASGSTFPLGDTTVSCTATDDAGNVTAPKWFTVTVRDTTPPVLHDVPASFVLEGNTTGGALGAYTAPTATDLVDPRPTVECQPAESALFELGETTVTCTATDLFGNMSSKSFTVTVVDTKAPILANVPSDTTVEGNTLGGAYWNYTPPTATDTVDDSPTVNCAPASTQKFALGATTVTCTATDDSDNTSSGASFVVTVVDTTNPTLTWVSTLPAPNAVGWNKSSVTVSWACSDIVGVLHQTTSQTLSGEGANQTATGTCTDLVGNTASAGRSGINIDLTNPLVALVDGPADGAIYYYGSVPPAPTCSASDALSGLAAPCAVTGYGAAVGNHTVKATASDKAGNSASASAAYSVKAWMLSGFYSPVDMGTTLNTVKGGSTVPLKFEVFAGSTELTSASTIGATFKAQSISCSTATALEEDPIEVLATGGTSLRYDSTGGQFIQNWQTPKLPGTCYKVTMTTQDGSTLSALFKLK